MHHTVSFKNMLGNLRNKFEINRKYATHKNWAKSMLIVIQRGLNMRDKTF